MTVATWIIIIAAALMMACDFLPARR